MQLAQTVSVFRKQRQLHRADYRAHEASAQVMRDLGLMDAWTHHRAAAHDAKQRVTRAWTYFLTDLSLARPIRVLRLLLTALAVIGVAASIQAGNPGLVFNATLVMAGMIAWSRAFRRQLRDPGPAAPAYAIARHDQLMAALRR